MTAYIAQLLLMLTFTSAWIVQEKTAKPRPQDPPSAEEVLEEILRKDQARPIIQPVLPVQGDPGEQRALLPDGTPLTDRTGRILKDGDDWLFVFEAENPDAAERPMRLLPNSMLERMVRQTQASQASPVFLVSGEITEYFGKNYLLVRMALLRLDTGNLSR